jgi:hypothetical protein
VIRAVAVGAVADVPVEAMGHMPLIAAADRERQRSIHLRPLFYFT